MARDQLQDLKWFDLDAILDPGGFRLAGTNQSSAHAAPEKLVRFNTTTVNRFAARVMPV